nr:rod shape-determining protein [Lachnospiraceae bacterium]
MQRSEIKQPKYVYGLDIGTRSVVGTIGYLEKDRFVVVAQRVKEHETRAMIDGQIHDIGAVGDMIREVTEELEIEVKQELKQVCIAAAGRVLRTVTTHVEIDLEGEKLIAKEDIFALDSYGVEKAYEQFQKDNDLDMKFYCVGYTVMRYYMNGYPMSNLENHKAKVIAADLIATFLPDDVVDGLYRAVELAGLEVANLTLEPIAAMEVAIPQMYRMLNIALIDVGAGTSDISITKDGSIVAYGMLPVAGDCLTEDIARHCLVDFKTAENIKCGIEKMDVVEYRDIMGIPQKIAKEEVLRVVEDNLSSMARQAADKIRELNGDKPVSAVFVVGGGGKIEGYTKYVAEYLGIPEERCAIRGEEVMQKIEFLPRDIVKDSLLVTPVGICLNFYEQSNNFMFVTFNGQRVKLYDNNKLAIVDAAIQAEFPNEDLFPKRGEALTFTLNGKERTVRGGRGESAVILLNGEPADIHTPIRANDVISVTCSTSGEKASQQLGRFPEYKETISIAVNGQQISLPKFASVNGELQTAYYEIQDGDVIEMLNYYTVEQITEVMDVLLEQGAVIRVNNAVAGKETKVYDNFTLEWSYEQPEKEEETSAESVETDEDSMSIASSHVSQEEKVSEAASPATSYAPSSGNDDGLSPLERARKRAEEIANAPVTEEVEEEFKKAKAYAAAERISAFATAFNQTGQMPPVVSRPVMPNFAMKSAVSKPAEQPAPVETPQAAPVSVPEPQPVMNQEPEPTPKPETSPVDGVTVIVNGDPVTLTGKQEYIYVDVFDRINFDLSKPQGKMVETLINGRKAQYIEPLHNGDELQIFWKD